MTCNYLDAWHMWQMAINAANLLSIVTLIYWVRVKK